MERARDSLSPAELAEDSVHGCKCQGPDTADKSPVALDHAFKRRKPDTPHLTQESPAQLKGTPQSESLEDGAAGCVQPKPRWAECESCKELGVLLTYALTSWKRNQRRAANLAQRQRSPSPTNNAKRPQYRLGMMLANVHMDQFPEAPAQVERHLSRILDNTAWTVGQRSAIAELARQYCDESRLLAKRCAGKHEWRDHLFLGLLHPLKRLEPDTLFLKSTVRPWLSRLKPTPVFPASHNLMTPKPEITLGLAHASFAPLQKYILQALQDDGHVLSEPHETQIGLHFPFLVVESAGGRSGGMVTAQNQAAMDGACALNVLGDMQRVAAHLKSQQGSSLLNQDASTQSQVAEDKAPTVVFSVITEGPLHEIWVHFRDGQAYHMTCHHAWRITRRQDAMAFVQALASIVEWGKRGFREHLVSLLGDIEQAMLRGGPVAMNPHL